MIIEKVDPTKPNLQTIKKAAETMRNGGVVLHPTDTAYGLAVNIFDSKAIQKILQIKNRDINKGIITAVRDLKMATDLAEFNNNALKIFKHYLPGPLTLLLPPRLAVPKELTGNNNLLSIRLPNNLVTQNLSKLSGLPYTTTSANPSGQANPYSLDQILKSFSREALELIDVALDAGELPPNPPSTIIDCSKEEISLVRPGPISIEDIQIFLTS